MGVKRPKSGNGKTIVGVWEREVGHLSTRNFAHCFAASQDLVLRLDILRKLEKHRGCVNTVSFNENGEILVSGSDDKKVILWDWEMGRVKLSFHSGHSSNIFQAKFMPSSDVLSIVTCAADGQVRHAQILDGGRVETSLLGRHGARAHKLAIELGSPYIFYTCGEDGLVKQFDLRTKASTELFTCHSTPERIRYSTKVFLDAIAIDPRNPNLVAVGGSDEYARVYDIRKFKSNWSINFDQPINYYCPEHLINDEQVGIAGLTFSDQSELLVSYSDEHIYLFSKDMSLGPEPVSSSPGSTPIDFSDTERNSVPQVYKGHCNRETVKGVGFFGPKSEYVVSGSDCGRIFIWKKKDGELLRAMKGDKYVVNCIEAHPYTTVLASSGIEVDIKIWTPKAEERANLPIILDEVVKRDHRFFFGFDDSESEDDDDDDDDDNNDDDDDEADDYWDGNIFSDSDDGDHDSNDDDDVDDDDDDDGMNDGDDDTNDNDL